MSKEKIDRYTLNKLKDKGRKKENKVRPVKQRTRTKETAVLHNIRNMNIEDLECVDEWFEGE